MARRHRRPRERGPVDGRDRRSGGRRAARTSQGHAAAVEGQSAQAASRRGYARAEELRYRPLLQRGAATKEAYEQKFAQWQVDAASVSAMEATIKVNEADIHRLTALQSYERLTAPFDGIVTARNVDPGDLITADNPTTENSCSTSPRSIRCACLSTCRRFFRPTSRRVRRPSCIAARIRNSSMWAWSSGRLTP